MVRWLGAVVFALVASEGILRLFVHDPAGSVGITPDIGITRPDPRLGWRFVPGWHGRLTVVGRDVDYEIDPDGNRGPRHDARSNPAAPSIVFAGESIMAGWGLGWDETIPALVGRRTALQPVDVAVFGYGTDQALRRLDEELPRFRDVRAVVSLFNVLQLERNTRPFQPGYAFDAGGQLVDRGPSGGWWSHLRLRLIWHQLPIHRAERVRMTAALLARTAERARAAGAVPIFVMPSYGPARPRDQHPEAKVVAELFDRQGLRCRIVDIDPAFRQGGGWHPTRPGARVLADAIADELTESPAAGRR